MQKQVPHRFIPFGFLALLLLAPLWGLAQSVPVASFTQDKKEGCLPHIVNFSDASTGTIASYFWDFGNGNTSTLKNPGALYTKAGTYSVKLIVTDNTGKKDSIVKTNTVIAYANPTAAFTGTPKSLCENEKVTFSDNSTEASNPITSWAWNFSDGSQSTQRNPVHTYTTQGTYSVSLIVIDSKGCKDILNQADYITVSKSPNVAFISDMQGGCAVPQTIKFTDKTSTISGKSYSYLWNFGDGTTSTQQNPSHDYTKQGAFTVSLTVTDNQGCSNTVSINNYINIGKTVAGFDAPQKNGCVPFAVAFNNTSQNVPSNATLAWDFGDGNKGSGYNPSHTYTQPGTYEVTLEITSPGGCNDKITKKNFITVYPAPILDFRSNDSVSCTTPANYQFYANTVNATDWAWDFGDGNTTNLQNPRKTYMSPGVYTVSLTVTFSNGCVVTQTKPNYIKNNTQKAYFTLSDSGGCAPKKIDFTNKSTAFLGIRKFEWNFGDGNTSTDENPSHLYTRLGTYYPSLTITDSAGCKSTYIFKTINLGKKVKPDFIAEPRAGCKQDMRNVKFNNITDFSQGYVDTFIWIIGGPEDVIKSYNPLVLVDYGKHIFKSSPDSIDITLISVSNGCMDTTIKKKYIVLFPPDVQVGFDIDNCKLDTVTFTNKSMGADTFRWWFRKASTSGGGWDDDDETNGGPGGGIADDWWVSDSTEIADKTVFKKFLTPGSYKLVAKGKNANGCKDSLLSNIKILNPLVASIGVAKKGLCSGDSITFYSKASNDADRYDLHYEWKINGKQVSVGEKENSFSYVFDDTNVFDVVLIITDVFGCVATDTAYDVGRNQKNPLNLTVTPDKGCFPLNAQLIFNSPPRMLSEARWIIEGETVDATKDTVPYLFNKIIPGMHTDGIDVIFEARDTLGCRLRKTKKVIVSSISADFVANPTLNCNNTELSFFNSSPSLLPYGGLTFDWKLNDTLTFTTSNNKYYFTKNGTHKLKLTVKDDVLGCSDVVEKPVEIKVKKLNAGFSVDNTAISCPPLISTFTDASYVENTSISRVLWSFGDGSSSTLATPVKNYFYPGDYDIVYTIFDARGCADSVVFPGKINVGGPKGSFVNDKFAGCAPLTVNYTASTLIPNILWDFGDGVISSGKIVQNTYTRPGTYQPYMVLQDSVGCVVFYPTKEPITVYASPEPDFTVNGICLYDTFNFINQTDLSSPTSFVWKFNNTDSVPVANTQYRFKTTGKHQVSLKAISINGCSATIQKTVEIPTLDADFGFSEKAACLDAAIQLVDKSNTGAGIKQQQWFLGDGRTENGAAPSVNYNTPGTYSISLIVEDNNGCFDSLLNGHTLVVYDTLPPLPPWAYRVTVEENNTLRFEFSEYPRPDFGKYIIYRALPGNSLQVYKEIDLQGDTVFIDKNVTPSDFSYTYRVVNKSFCGKYSSQTNSRAHTSILLQGMSDTNKVHLFWSNYIGWDVVKSYHIYRKEPQKQTFEHIATVPGTQPYYTDTNAYCGVSYRYYVIAEENALPVQFSRSNTITLAPIHIVTVEPGTIIRATVENDKNILVEFAPPANIKAPIELYTMEKSANGVNYQTIYTTPSCCPSYTDEQVNVHNQSYYYRVRCTDYCGDVSEPGNLGKSILLGADINTDENVAVDWSAYQKWNEGVNHYELEMQNAYGNFESTGFNNITDTAYTDESGNYNYLSRVCYRVKAVSNTGVVSYSNTDCVKGRSSLFVPNAFTPNKDGINTTFIIVGSYIKTFKLRIFNRYGELIFTSESLEHSWDGTFKGVPVQDGAYLYVINAIGMDGKQHNPSGTVTLLR